MHTHVTLRRRGFDVTGFAFPPDVILRYYDDGAAAFDIARLDVEQDSWQRGIPDSLDYPYLVIKLLTVMMYSATVAHTENSLTNYAGFMPTTVRQDGRQPSVGEVQNIINFQLLIATPTTLLLSDHSHVALDPRGAEIMRRFRRDLLDFQEEMEGQPSRYWQLFPGEVEASVSC